ncbi:MAG: hypothetical protein HYY21_05820 [Candidatus Tectomicrobia bacterium]|nr:hypothetical protein [Candidatus Tectomicrobia bacterium]
MDRRRNLGSLNRAERVERSRRKTAPPYLLDEGLTFYCPQENLESLRHPVVAAFHRHVLERYRPPRLSGRAVLLILPCTRVKPYILSPEHLAINAYLDGLGFRPVARTRRPADLALPEGVAERLLEVSPLRKGTRCLHRMVISEPMGLVPYEYLYYFNGGLSPVSRYDDPGLFERRRNAVCPWRKDSTAAWRRGGYAWGPGERRAYVLYHNALVERMTRALLRLRPRYERFIAYVSPKLTHRSFLTSREEKRADGIAPSRRAGGETLGLIGVNDLAPGLVEVAPGAEEIVEARARLARRLRGAGVPAAESAVRAHFARGGGAGTPLTLPEVLDALGRRLAPGKSRPIAEENTHWLMRT